MYFAKRCACYPYIFPTIFPRAAAGRSLHSRLRNLYCAPVTMTTLLFSPAMVFLLKIFDLFRVYRIARRLSILMPGLWKSTGEIAGVICNCFLLGKRALLPYSCDSVQQLFLTLFVCKLHKTEVGFRNKECYNGVKMVPHTLSRNLYQDMKM